MKETTQQPVPEVSTCFVSYSWDSEDHRAWVKRMATALRSEGVDARMDQWEACIGMDLPQYMENRIRSSDYIILVCTPPFAERANSGKGGVGYEKGVITGEIYRGVPSTKFIPVLRSGSTKESLPSYLLNKLFVDFRKNSDFDAGIQLIVRHIYQMPESELPPLGKARILGHTGVASSVRDQQGISFSSLMEYAYTNYPGLDVTEEHIREITGNVKQLGYRNIDDLDMAIRPVRHIARKVDCWACQRYACDQITIALALSNPEYFRLLGSHQAQHTEWLRKHKARLRSDRKGWL